MAFTTSGTARCSSSSNSTSPQLRPNSATFRRWLHSVRLLSVTDPCVWRIIASQICDRPLDRTISMVHRSGFTCCDSPISSPDSSLGISPRLIALAASHPSSASMIVPAASTPKPTNGLMNDAMVPAVCATSRSVPTVPAGVRHRRT